MGWLDSFQPVWCKWWQDCAFSDWCCSFFFPKQTWSRVAGDLFDFFCVAHSIIWIIRIQFLQPLALSPLISPTPSTPTGLLHVYDFQKITPAALCFSPFLSLSVTAFSANSRPSFPHFLCSQSKFLTDSLTRESHCAVWQTQHRQEMSTLKIENERKKNPFMLSWDKMQKLGVTGAEFPSHSRSAKTFCPARLIPSPHLLRLTEHISQLLWSRIIFAYLKVGRTKRSLKSPSSHWISVWISY